LGERYACSSTKVALARPLAKVADRIARPKGLSFIGVGSMDRGRLNSSPIVASAYRRGHADERMHVSRRSRLSAPGFEVEVRRPRARVRHRDLRRRDVQHQRRERPDQDRPGAGQQVLDREVLQDDRQEAK
jgi:hypothetical protein